MSTPSRPPADPPKTGSVAAVLALVLGGLGFLLALSPDSVFIALFLGLAGLVTAPVGLGDVKHLPDRVRSRVRKQALAGAALSVVALVLVVLVLLGADQRAAIEDSALPLLLAR